MRPTRFRPTLALFGTIAAAIGVVVACADDPHRRTSPEQALGGGGACKAEPGVVPEANCDDSEGACVSSPGCTIDEARCGAPTTCLPMADNKGKDVQDFRIRRLNVATPPALAGSFIQKTVIDLNIDLAAKQCGEIGKGLFTWLLRVDRAKGEIVTGGAPPSSDPYGLGYCFARLDLAGQQIEPVTAKVAFEGETFGTVAPLSVKIPIFLTEDAQSAILLPIRDARLSNVAISAEGNCIGQFRSVALDPACAESRELCTKWVTAGALGGHITLEDADTVRIRELNNKTLCAFLAGDSALACPRDPDGKISFKGDYCEATHAAGGCQDSVWLAATFAASAVKIFDGQGTVAACSGAPSGDAGADAGGDADVTPDAGADGG